MPESACLIAAEDEASASDHAVYPDPAVFEIDKLDFELPSFLRVSWVSDPARKLWEPRFKRLATVLAELEWLSVASGVRPCCVTEASPADFCRRSRQWQRLGLSALPLEPSPEAAAPGSKFILGRPRDLNEYLDAEESSGTDAGVGQLLGVPPCCYEFQRYVWVDLGIGDPTWPIAVMTERPSAPVRTVSIPARPHANFFWRRIGMSLVAHLPCSFNCPSTRRIADQVVDLANTSGYDAEMGWLLEILDWPLSWSTLHGIAEVKTPLLKFTYDSMPTAGRYEIRYLGNSSPELGSKGLVFPFRTPERPILSNSTGYRKGMDNPILPIINN